MKRGPRASRNTRGREEIWTPSYCASSAGHQGEGRSKMRIQIRTEELCMRLIYAIGSLTSIDCDRQLPVLDWTCLSWFQAEEASLVRLDLLARLAQQAAVVAKGGAAKGGSLVSRDMTSCLILQAGGKQRHPPHSTHLNLPVGRDSRLPFCQFGQFCQRPICRWDWHLVCC